MSSFETDPSLDSLDFFILARLLAKSPTPASTKKDVGVIAAVQLTPGEWTSLFELHWNRLREANLIGPQPGKKPGKTLVLTEAGRRRAIDFVGVADVPADTSWAKLQTEYLVPKAMGLAPGSKEAAALKSAGPLQLSIVSRDKQIPTREGMVAKKLLASLAWQAIGVESEAEFTAENVIQQLVFHCAAKKMSTAKVMAALAASAVGAAKTGVADLRAAALRKWLLAPSGGESQTDSGSQHLDARGDGSPESFADGVIDAARRCPADARFGDSKVFISRVWRQLNGGPAAGHDLPSFKEKLIDANRDGLIQLSRADLVEAMNPVDVEESATIYGNAMFHFVRVPEP